jgi:hypothetical protein
MNSATLTMMPILIDVEKLSKKELIEKCKEQQETMMLQDKALQSACDQLGNMCRCAHDLGAQLYALVDSFDANDHDAVKLQMQRMSDQRRSVLAQKVKVH